ncbi:MAG TPA: trehalose-6-phosphate synthase [Acidimicrobiales bacterium]
MFTRAPSSGRPDLVVVAHRLPVHRQDGETVTSPGGLVSALSPVLSGRSAVWVGWPGPETLSKQQWGDGTWLHPVVLDEREREEHLHGFCNDTLWPLFHGAAHEPAFDHACFESYRAVNERFAAAVAETVGEGGTVWVHDYQLLLVPAMVRALRADVSIGLFLHIPFPPLETFAHLPWRDELTAGMLGADLVGFQREDHVSNFVAVAERFGDATVTGSGLRVGSRPVTAAAHPISIDVEAVSSIARASTDQARAMRSRLGNPRHLLLGVDRLDYTKGIVRRLEAFEAVLAEGLLDPEHTVLLQVAVPTREGVARYVQEREQVERLVGRLNGRFAKIGRPVVHYVHQSLPFCELVALYLAADALLVTSLGDGMNLVAKEFVASRVDGRGALVLSEFAGAADELREALLVNSYDVEALSRAIVAATVMPGWAAGARMRAMQARLRVNDVHQWARVFLDELANARTAWCAA